MQIIHAVSRAAPDRTHPSANEDTFRIGPDWALVLDGAGRYPGLTGGCVHPVTWIVTHLADHIARRLSTDDNLTAVLRAAIEATAAEHGPDCDLADPLSPGATLALIRARADAVEWLVLGDCAAVVEVPGVGCEAVIDDRVDQLAGPVNDAAIRTYDPGYVARVRNQPGGFWVAGAVAEAADYALVGRIPRDSVDRVLLCSDGVTRLAERYGWSWPRVLDLAEGSGADGVIQAVRQAERDDPDPSRWRGKRHDDATLVLVRLPEERP